ncbi:hypothetical protein [Actinophytocola oryzae]|uniref:Uncharacterized protein n=1 Tax=Actinophytocola oryzae TaxID=502181 RepID=A0A4R7W108_9PSEU|nr:hypothetical protein [Actinophytocola oryzae]TDV56092.1 hypothetical protein CLV71_102153 [Actinophytocola oryzae]
MTDLTKDVEWTPAAPARRRLTDSRRGRLMFQTVLPVVVGVAGAVAIGAKAGIPSALMMCAGIYLVAAATGVPVAAWWSLAGAVPLVGLGAVFDNEWLSLLALGVVQAVLLVIGGVRGRWRQRDNLLQVVAAVVFAALAIASAAGTPVVAAVILIVGLLAHGVWDVVHHRAGIVVARSYSAFCAGLDAALALVVLIALVTHN